MINKLKMKRGGRAGEIVINNYIVIHTSFPKRILILHNNYLMFELLQNCSV